MKGDIAMENDSEKAALIFSEGYNCAQAVLAACGERYGLDKATALKVSQVFGGGIGRTGHVCGAVSGALMCIGLKYPAQNGGDTAGKERAHLLAQRFIAEFERKHKTILCRELLGCEIRSAEGHNRARELGVFKAHCPEFVRDAARMINEILEGESNASR